MNLRKGVKMLINCLPALVFFGFVTKSSLPREIDEVAQKVSIESLYSVEEQFGLIRQSWSSVKWFDIEGSYPTFTTEKHFSKQEVVNLLIDCWSLYTNTWNGYKDARPYFKDYPFRKVSLSIYFNNSDSEIVYASVSPNHCNLGIPPESGSFEWRYIVDLDLENELPIEPLVKEKILKALSEGNITTQDEHFSQKKLFKKEIGPGINIHYTTKNNECIEIDAGDIKAEGR